MFTTKAMDETTVTIDATGCDIGDHIHSSISISGLTVHDATQFGHVNYIAQNGIE